MDPKQLEKLLTDFQQGKADIADVLQKLRDLPFEESGDATIDHHRELRQGAPEVIFGEGKTVEQLKSIISRMCAKGSNILATRLDPNKAGKLTDSFPQGEYDPLARTFSLINKEIEVKGRGKVLIICAGTSDLPVAREALVTARMLGNEVEELVDVGVAGIHRLLAKTEKLHDAAVIIVVAGMEGALPSVVGGLVGVPVIAVPTSIGYGAAFGGIAALLGMLNSCASGVTVVNIDNGFGAAFAATRINPEQHLMRTLYLDTFSGIAGDMFLGLMFDLGINTNEVITELSKLDLAGYAIDTRTEKRCGIAGTYVDISIEDDQPHRAWSAIDAMIVNSGLNEADKGLARHIFRRLGEAEAKIHGITLEKVHFHEVGAVDSIIDIVGAAIALNRLGVDQVLCAPLPLGQGSIKSAHGEYPLPAPATLEVLTGCPTRADDSGLELVTPTGAVIATEISTFVAMPEMTIEKIGYGLGTRDMENRPNVLRGIIGDAVKIRAEDDTVTVIETHLDDCNPEWLGHLIDILMDNGALDVAYTPLQMKKNRPGTRVTVISPIELAHALEKLLLRHSSAIGVRRYDTRRRKLRRENKTVPTAIGDAIVKCLYDGDELIRITPEFESCRMLAEKNKQPLPEVYRLAERAADTLFDQQKD